MPTYVVEFLLGRYCASIDQAEIEVVHSEGLHVESGLSYWNGALAADEEAVMEIAYTLVENPPQEIIVKVKGQTLEGRDFQKQESRVIEFK